MAPTEPTILTLKQNFLAAQTRLLSQPLQPSRAWQRGNENAISGGDDDEDDVTRTRDQRLPERAVDDALFRLNHTLQQHARRVYAPQATRHVAEQIEGLYLAFGDRHVLQKQQEEGDVLEDEDAWRMMGADYDPEDLHAHLLVNPAIISSLPPTWDSEREASVHLLEAKRYSELVEQLQGLSERREATEARVRRLRKMKALLQPFSSEESSTAAGATAAAAAADVGNGVQENLVTRDGEVERELERMRMLLARVGDKVARARERDGFAADDDDDDLFGEGDAMIVDDVEVEERRKVEGLLSGLG